ncbi:hypothetical protein EMIT07CA2_210053 [Brevibacillus sp. IT-7CA2]
MNQRYMQGLSLLIAILKLYTSVNVNTKFNAS